MLDPKYDEDLVNLGYLVKVLGEIDFNIPEGISRHFGSRPQPPYHAGDTWNDGSIVYTCINTRLVGVYTDSDWVTESGAKALAQTKNRVFLTQPSNYIVGDMWILQSDTDHIAGLRGEVLVSLAQRAVYNASDWVNTIGYGAIRSINEVAINIKVALDNLGISLVDGLVTVYYQEEEPISPSIYDLWYYDGTLKIYRNDIWEDILDEDIINAFKNADEQRLTADGKLQIFFNRESPFEDLDDGDLWIDVEDNKLYRFNGTNWILCYAIRIEDLISTSETTVQRVVKIETDLGIISMTVMDEITTIKDEMGTQTKIVEQIRTDFDQTSRSFNFRITTIEDDGVSKVKNTTVVIDESGITVARLGEEMNTNFNNDGLIIRRNTDVVLNVNSTGVEALNLWAKKYLRAGENLRIEDFKDPDLNVYGSGFFYVGE